MNKAQRSTNIGKKNRTRIGRFPFFEGENIFALIAFSPFFQNQVLRASLATLYVPRAAILPWYLPVAFPAVAAALARPPPPPLLRRGCQFESANLAMGDEGGCCCWRSRRLGPIGGRGSPSAGGFIYLRECIRGTLCYHACALQDKYEHQSCSNFDKKNLSCKYTLYYKGALLLENSGFL